MLQLFPRVAQPQTLVAGSIGVVLYFLVKRVGKDVAQYLDQYGQDILDSFNASRSQAVRSMEEAVQREEALEGMLECRKEAFDVLRVRVKGGRRVRCGRRVRGGVRVRVNVDRFLTDNGCQSLLSLMHVCSSP